MACKLKILLFVIWLVTILQPIVAGLPQVPCYFVFGDSLVDNGNNNLLATTAKVNYLPYGIDFPGGPTGRFTNGRNIADIIGQLLGFDSFIPPFATASGNEVLKGVNYGSGSSGILDETGKQLGAILSLNKQLANHLITTTRVSTLLGSKEAASVYLGKCLYLVNMGTNDYVNNYFMPQIYPTSRLYNPDQFADALVKQYSQQLRNLYALGARKVAIFGLGLLGCIPFEVTARGIVGSTCVNEINNAVGLFNSKLKPLVDELNKELLGAHFIYIDNAAIAIGNAQVPGTNTNSPCCAVLPTGQCTPSPIACPNRNLYTFYDGIHPTEAQNVMTGGRAYNAKTPLDAYPMDIHRLAQL